MDASRAALWMGGRSRGVGGGEHRGMFSMKVDNITWRMAGDTEFNYDAGFPDGGRKSVGGFGGWVEILVKIGRMSALEWAKES